MQDVTDGNLLTNVLNGSMETTNFCIRYEGMCHFYTYKNCALKEITSNIHIITKKASNRQTTHGNK